MFNQTKVGGFGAHPKAPGNIQQTQMRQTMFNGNFMNKMRTSNGGQNSSGGKYQTQSYN